MGLKSRTKGKVGEREAVNFLKSLGFEDARRTVQFNGRDGKSDVVCPESLPNVHIEVKYGYERTAFDIGSQLFENATLQADVEADGKPWIVLWRPKRCADWRGTFIGFNTLVLTAYGQGIAGVLRLLNETKL